LTVSVNAAATLVTIGVVGEIDIATAPRLVAILGRQTKLEPTAPVVLDLFGVTFIDCSGVALLIGAHEQIGERLQVLASSACLRVLDLLNVTDRLPLVRESPRSPRDSRAPRAARRAR
jgi:anti-anti-sigma factor